MKYLICLVLVIALSMVLANAAPEAEAGFYKRGCGVERSQLEEKEAVLKGKESVLKEEEANFEAKGD